jgi:hypothetical protein
LTICRRILPNEELLNDMRASSSIMRLVKESRLGSARHIAWLKRQELYTDAGSVSRLPVNIENGPVGNVMRESEVDGPCLVVGGPWYLPLSLCSLNRIASTAKVRLIE